MSIKLSLSEFYPQGLPFGGERDQKRACESCSYGLQRETNKRGIFVLIKGIRVFEKWFKNEGDFIYERDRALTELHTYLWEQENQIRP